MKPSSRAQWLWLLAVPLLVAGLLRLRFDVDVLNLLPAELPAVQGLKLYQEHFAKAHELVITVSAADAETTTAAARSLAETLRGEMAVERAICQAPWLENPRDAAELVAFLWYNGRAEAFSNLANRLSGTNLTVALRTVRERLATTLSPDELARLPHDPLDLMNAAQIGDGVSGGLNFQSGDRVFASEDGTFRLIFVQPKGDLRNYRQAGEWCDAIRAVIHTWQRNPEFASAQINFTGGPAFASEIGRGMERDTTKSVLGTVAVIVVLFWLAHRRFRPLLWLICLMAVILAMTLSAAGLIFGTLNVVSIGFAAILLGLAVDYGLVLYQQARAEPHLTPREIRGRVGSSIVWSAVTTAGAFMTLNFGGLPGLAQLGTMVGIGVLVAALMMLYAYLPPLHMGQTTGFSALPSDTGRQNATFSFLKLATIFAAIGITLVGGFPKLDATSDALRPGNSAAYATLREIQEKIGGEGEPAWLLVSGRTESEVADKLVAVEKTLNSASNSFARYELPTQLFPNPSNQASNAPIAKRLAAAWPRIRQATIEEGFTADSLRMSESIFAQWAVASGHERFVPTNSTMNWISEKLIARDKDKIFVAGMIHELKPESALEPALLNGGALLAGWNALGSQLIKVVYQRTWQLLLAMTAILLGALWMAFRRWLEVLLAIGTLALAVLSLLTIMRWAGWSWNLMNLMSVPLVLGTGIDYSIHMQSALRRNRGDIRATRRTTGRALLLCGSTTIVGFGSLAWSNNSGLASLGGVCAAGIACAMVISLYVLPGVWRALASEVESPLAASESSRKPSMLYRRGLWRLGLAAARYLPASACVAVMTKLTWLYSCLARGRRRIVVENVLPAVAGDRKKARIISRNLFRQFAVKLVDLWRFETGKPADSLLIEESGWEHFMAARASGRGILIVTPHLGNWEFGGPLLIRRGVPLHVVTQVEPGQGFTELRKDARAQWGIETHVIGDQPFAVIEVIKLLERGAAVALLIDRPPPSTAVEVELFGRPFQASLAAAELARASGCVVLPVALPRLSNGYAARIFPEIAYERSALNKREARVEFTQMILRTFEPIIQKYPEQWYHFVPIWPR
jgi:uncharacterized protein